MYSSKNTNQFSISTENSPFDDIFIFIFIFIIRYHHIFFSVVCVLKCLSFWGLQVKLTTIKWSAKFLSNIRLQKKWLCFFSHLQNSLKIWFGFLSLSHFIYNFWLYLSSSFPFFLSEIYLFAFWMVWIFGVSRAKKNRRWR